MFIKAARQWVASPLGLNILFSKLKEGKISMDKYIQIAKAVKETKLCTIDTNLFLSSSCKSKDEVKSLVQMCDIEETDFSRTENGFSTWANTHGDFKIVAKEISSKTDFILANVTLFQSNWSSATNSTDQGPQMKVYNSFNYTQDVKYEARLLELPLKSQVKLVIVVPNEVDVLQSLFTTLTSQGLDAAIQSIQPLFTVNCELNAPNIDVTSIVYAENPSALTNNTIVQYGNLLVNKEGVTVKVMTCMCCPSNVQAIEEDQHQSREQPFYLAVTYQDIPLFIGQFTK